MDVIIEKDRSSVREDVLKQNRDDFLSMALYYSYTHEFCIFCRVKRGKLSLVNIVKYRHRALTQYGFL